MYTKFLYGRTSRKPDRKVLRAGTFFLFDTANLLASTGLRRAARTLEVISWDLASQGYRTLFFLERRSFDYVRARQDSVQDAAMLEAFARRGDVVLLDEECGGEKSEADDAMLQLAEVLPNSVCITRDKFLDYAAIHPGVVKSGRVRGYKVVRLDDAMYITIKGLKRAVVIDGIRSESAFAAIRSELEAKASPISDEWNVDDAGLCAKVDGARRAGRSKAKPSRRALAAIRDLALCSEDEDWDSRFLIDAKREARRIHSARRNIRLRARAIREGSSRLSHCSRKRREAAGIAVLGSRLGYGRIA